MATSITDRINQMFKERDLRPVDVARAVGVKKQTVSDWTSGRTTNIKPENLVALADVLGVEIRWLANGIGPKLPPAKLPEDIASAAAVLAALPPATRAAFITVVMSKAA